MLNTYKKAKQIIDAAQYIVTNFNSIVPCIWKVTGDKRCWNENGCIGTVGRIRWWFTCFSGHQFPNVQIILNVLTLSWYWRYFRSHDGGNNYWLPKNYWRELNSTFLGMGKLFCLVKKNGRKKCLWKPGLYKCRQCIIQGKDCENITCVPKSSETKNRTAKTRI